MRATLGRSLWPSNFAYRKRRKKKKKTPVLKDTDNSLLIDPATNGKLVNPK